MRTQLTKQLLNGVASHLSSRPECRGVTYRMVIGVPETSMEVSIEGYKGLDISNYITFYPRVMVFPDRYHRKECHRLSILEHMLTYHFKDELFAGKDDKGNLRIIGDNIVPGIYEYQSSIDNKRRRWVRIK